VPRSLVFVVLACTLGIACKSAGAPGARAPESPPATPGIDPSIVDPSVKPCDDFYRYACGGWIARTPIPPEKSIWSRGFSEVEERNVALLRDIAQANAASQFDPKDRFPEKVGDFYAACMDEAGIEARGTKDLLAQWSRIDQVKDVPTLAKELGVLHKEGLFPLFRVESDQDAKDATQVIGVVEQGGLSLPDRDYYLKEDPKSAAIQQAYREHVTRMFELAGVPAAQAAENAKAVYGLEHALAQSHWTRVEMRDPQRTYNRVDLAGLEKAAPRFPWKAYLDALGHGRLTTFSTTTPRFLTRIDELLATTPLATWRTYLAWRVLSATASHRALPKAFFDERFAFMSKHFTGAEKQEIRWKDCVRATDGALGEALGQAFVRRHFGEDSKARTRQMVSEIEGAMGRTLDSVGWMDDATRKKGREKLAKVVNKIGYPDSWRDYGALHVDRGSYFNSLLAAQAFEVNRDLSKIGKPVDRNEWEMSPPTVNAYYNPSMNEMVFPAGILQPPFFTRGAPDTVNYGAIGMVQGHELTHGFDDQGRQYDALGNLTDWWTPSVSAEFDRRAACVAKQFDGYVAVDDVKLNGNLTLGENIADLGGLRLAYAAWRQSLAGKPAAPVAGFTPEQAFFIGYAQSWCAAVRPEAARLRAATDPHSPPRWRVNGPLSNLAAFQEAFSCPAGSTMVRAGEQRCEVW